MWGGGPIWAILGRWSPGLGAGTLKKRLGKPCGVLKLEREDWGKPDPQDSFEKMGGQVGGFFSFFSL